MIKVKNISELNPPPEIVDFFRDFNILLAAVACSLLLWLKAIPAWNGWTVPRRLSWMALFMSCLAISYGTFETKYLGTYFRIPMITVSLLWAILAAVWPNDDMTNKRRRSEKR